MRKIVIWLVPLVLFGVILFSPAVTVAALTPGGAWQQVIGDSADLSISNAGMDIRFVRHAYEGGFHYFEMELEGDPNTFASSLPALSTLDYSIYIQTSGVVGYPNPKDITFGYDKSFTVQTSGISVAEDGHVSKLNWRTDPFFGDGDFTFMGVTLLNGGSAGIDFTNSASAVVPIPGAAYLLGTGLIGLVGLRRRSVRKA